VNKRIFSVSDKYQFRLRNYFHQESRAAEHSRAFQIFKNTLGERLRKNSKKAASS
jgi:sugar diacid utilization regulator